MRTTGLVCILFASPFAAGTALADPLTYDRAGATVPPAVNTGTWDTAVGNNVWDNGAGNVRFQNGDEVTFGGTGEVVTVDNGAVRPDQIRFTASGYQIASGGGATDVITVGDGASALAIQVTSGNSATISAPLERTAAGTATVTINGGGTGNSGTLTLSGDSTLAGTTVNLARGRLNLNGTLTATTVSNTGGTLDIAPGSVVTGNVTNDATARNGGIITGNVTTTGGTFINESTANIGGNVNVNGGSLTNNGGGSITGNTTVNDGGTLIANGGLFTGDITNAGGQITIAADTTKAITNSDGNLTIDNGVTLTGDLTNDGGDAENNGTLSGALDLSGGTFRHNATGDIAGDVTITGGTLVADGGDFLADVTQSGGTLRYTGDSTGDVTKTAGVTTITGTGTLRGDLTQDGGRTTIQDGGLLTGNLVQNGGETTNSGTIGGTVGLTDGTLTVDGGTVTGLATVTGGTLESDGGTFTAGVLNNGGNVNVTSASTGDITNQAGTTTLSGGLTGTLTVTGGTARNNTGGNVSGLTNVTGGTLVGNGGNFAGGVENNGGAVDIVANTGGRITNITGNTVIRSGAQLTGSLTNAGTGTSTNNGVITGNVSVQAGTVNNNGGNIRGNTAVATGGTLNGNGGNFSGGVENNGGQVNITADTAGNIDNVTGNTDIATGAQLDGNLTNSGAGVSTNNGEITGTVAVEAGTVNNNGGDISGPTVVTTDGTLNGNGGGFSGGITNEGGTVDITADTTGSLTTEAGNSIIRSGATLTGSVVSNGGRTTNNGAVTSTVAVTGGQFISNGGSLVGGQTRVSGTGLLTANGGTFTGGILAAGGNVIVDGAVAGNLTNTGGEVVINVGAGLTGNIAQSGGTTNNSGAVTGGVALTGAAEFTNNAGGTISGETTVAGTSVLTGEGGAFAGGIENNGGTVNIVADTTGSVRNLDGVLTVGEGLTLTGTVTNAASTTLQGTIAGDFINRDNGTLSFGAVNAATVTGSFANLDGGVIRIAADETLTTGTFTNEAGGVLSVNGRLNGPVTNRGGLTTQSGNFGGEVTNESTIRASGDVAFEGGLNGPGTLDLTGNTANPAGITSDVVRIGGTGLGSGAQLRFDTDLGENSASSDSIVMTGNAVVSGTIGLQFASFGEGDPFAGNVLLIDVVEANQGAIAVNTTGLPDAGDTVVYTVQQIGGVGDLVLQANTNPGIGALVGSVALTQSLIGSVINRPSSPFVSGLAYEDPDPCGTGLWGRVTGGQADATGSSTDENTGNGEPITSQTETSASYAGIQLGGDFACFNGYFNGWDLAFGGILGLNQGTISQPIFALTSAGGAGAQISETSGDFRQSYGGIYTTAAKGPLAVDLQYRLEKTDFKVSNTRLNGSIGLGLDDTEFSSNAQTLSGSVSYAFPIKDTAFTILPTAGFAWTRTSTDQINLLDNDRVQLQDFENQTLFVGATAARSKVAEDGNSAFNQFVTATYYNDFADEPTALFTDGSTGATRTIALDNLGAYGELSLGVSYVRILNPGQIGPARQLNASIRADARVGKQLESWGITGQVRLQF